MLPKVILHNAVSLDGRIDGFPLDLYQYYKLAASWKEDATLAGSDTFLKAAEQHLSRSRPAGHCCYYCYCRSGDWPAERNLP